MKKLKKPSIKPSIYGPTTRRARQNRRRRAQVLRAKARYRARRREARRLQEQKRRRQEDPIWSLSPERPATIADPAGADYGSRIPADHQAPMPSEKKRRVPAAPRRAFRVEPTRRTHGPNRGGESARSWQPAGERNPTRVPLDVADFLKEEF